MWIVLARTASSYRRKGDGEAGGGAEDEDGGIGGGAEDEDEGIVGGADDDDEGRGLEGEEDEDGSVRVGAEKDSTGERMFAFMLSQLQKRDFILGIAPAKGRVKGR